MIDNNAIADALENCDWSDTSIGTKGILLAAINALREIPSVPHAGEGAVPVGWTGQKSLQDIQRNKAGFIYQTADGISDPIALYAAAPHPPRQDSLCSDCPPIGYPTDKTRCLPCPRRQDGAREGELVEPPSKLDPNWRSRCKELWQKLGRDQMLRQGDPVETLMEFYDEVWIEGWQEGDNTPIPSLAALTPLDTTPPAPDEAHTISMSFAAYEEAIAEAEARGRAGHKGTGEPPAPGEALNWRIEKAVEAEREACAELAKSYGPSRPIIKKDPDDIIKARWEGEQAASDGISRLILARGAFDKRTLRQVLENELIDAVDFFDKVRASSQEEQVAVGQDHYNRLDTAVRKLVSFLRPKK